ncbi:uncharacterized protein LOC129599256 [Paramacrobiotus metropolitanus]|uniref:uncharacterized protein LOC129599256 n=1 Tax=Paramacrobiotus metropolitanus TaxID=2943436 RepID=UPI002445AB3F|nr:uncharacterized protein LOC129599256 [Paramacrobiotus metropolitanus]XP_055353421.1 uncharacterized protein LOC129599256 [Paramacrobiotus metropolitanus]
MNATSLYFKQLYSGSRDVNYGNTVLVQRDGGQCWLGYVRDIDVEYFFVDFDSSTVHAEWIHSKHLWPHHFLQRQLAGDGSSWPVAIRDRDGGPLTFRPATIIGPLCDMFCIVRLENENPVNVAIVHESHFAAQLPTTSGEPCFFGRTNGIVYQKHVISFRLAYLLNNVQFLPRFLAGTCRLALSHTERRYTFTNQYERTVGTDHFAFVCEWAHEPAVRRIEFDVGCRAFVRAGVDTVTFICAEVHGTSTKRTDVVVKDLRVHTSLRDVDELTISGRVDHLDHHVDELTTFHIRSWRALHLLCLWTPSHKLAGCALFGDSCCKNTWTTDILFSTSIPYENK